MKREKGGSKREKFLKKAKESVQESLRSRDMVLSGVTKTIDETQRVINQLTERFEAWYDVYFPELKIEDRKQYVEVAIYLDREKIGVENLASIAGRKKAEAIANAAGKSLGAQLNKKDIEEIKLLGKRIISLYSLIEELEKYQKELAEEIAPNISDLAGADIAAKLIAHAGSLDRLAKMPSSTIQVIGAEKALFKHLKNKKIKPPKHGIIFQHAKISSSPKAVRGKIARALANKLATAAKADAFTGHDIGDSLKKDLDARLAKIMGEYERKKKVKVQ